MDGAKKEELKKRIDENTRKIQNLLGELEEFKSVLDDVEVDVGLKRKQDMDLQVRESPVKATRIDDKSRKDTISSQAELIAKLRKIIDELTSKEKDGNNRNSPVVLERTRQTDNLRQTYKRNLEEKERIIHSLYDTIIRLRAELEKIRKYVSESSSRDKDLEISKSENLVREKDAAASRLQTEFSEKLAEKDEIIRSLNGAITRIRSEFSNIKLAMKDVLGKEEEIKRKENFFRKDIFAKEQLISKLDSEILRLKGILDRKSSIENDLKSAIYRKNSEIEKKDKEIEEKINVRLKELVERQKYCARLLGESYRDKEEKIKEIKDECDKKLFEKEDIIQNLNATVLKLKNDLTSLRYEMKGIQSLEETIKKKEAEFKEILFGKDQMISRLETDILRINGLLERKSVKESELKGAIFRRDKEILQKERRIEDISAKEDTIKSDLSALISRIKGLSQKINLDSEELKLKNEAIKKMLHEMKSLEEVNREKNKIISQIQDDNKRLSSENSDMRNSITKLRAQIDKKERYLIEIENDVGISRLKSQSMKKKTDALLAENLAIKKAIKENTTEFARKNISLDKEISFLQKKHLIELKSQKDEYERRIGELIKEHMNSELSLKLSIENQNKIIEEQNKVIMDKREKEKEIAMELTTRIREAILLGSPKIKSYSEALENPAPARMPVAVSKEEKPPERPTQVNIPEMSDSDIREEIKKHEKDKKRKEFHKKLGVDEKKSHVEPLVRMALDHGEKPEKILSTLIKSGHDAEEVKAAINRNLMKKED